MVLQTRVAFLKSIVDHQWYQWSLQWFTILFGKEAKDSNLIFSAGLLETILITNIVCGSHDLPPLPKWLRILVLKYLARLACMKKSCDKNFEVSCLAKMLRCEEGQSGPTYDSLQEVIDKKSFRPSVNLSSPTITNISFTLYAILGVNEKAQILTTFLWLRLYWFHEFLIWDPEACDGITKISLPVKDLWTPDIIVYEFVTILTPVTPLVKDVRVSPALSFKEMTGNSKRYLQASGEWELVVILGDADILNFGIEEWDIITFWILYVVNLIIPSSFLMIIDIMSFYLPPHSVDRSSFKMTLILGYTVFLLIMNDLLPSTANGTPLIGIYFSVCLALMTISLLETVLITCVLHHNSMKYREVPHWVQVLVMRFIARLICYSFPEDPLAKLEGKQETNPWVVQPSQSMSSQQTSTNASGSMTLDVPELRQISQDLREMNTYLSILRKEDHLQNQWCHVGYILDFLLFRIYLLIITGYALVIICMWCIWMNQ
ncbi:5-hydroxytryptamine receptor 3E-like [Sinocyclocheilus grahami]|uniref:5-hydroxytryptamine receptor 3E-like n=1 Tax=Sinocyclocheilus grahami TaxID=75366 RepID=UPI0007AD590A|nr:PREDICTED: 5-hydroxytryptamine receptor 3E-like [Sinocyclocheilus grahami]